jgi:murein DD-endopeptidase MepM/ murein hydrolase activator NlpD
MRCACCAARLSVRGRVCVATAALVFGLVLLVAPAAGFAQGATGGALGPVAIVSLDVADAGGAQAPIAQATGGSQAGIVLPAPRNPSAHTKSGHSRPSHPRSPKKPASKPKPKPKPAPKPAPEPAPKPPAGETPSGLPTPAQTVADGAVFPVRGGPHSFGGPENRFGAPRAGHIHEGQDILAAEGLSDVAPLAGTIITTGNQPGAAGWYVAEHTPIGFDLFFAHCEANSIDVTEGQAVKPGTELCKLGSTGDATAPHLHFEMWVGGWQAKGGHPFDPLPYLEAWEGH